MTKHICNNNANHITSAQPYTYIHGTIYNYLLIICNRVIGKIISSYVQLYNNNGYYVKSSWHILSHSYVLCSKWSNHPEQLVMIKQLTEDYGASQVT